MGGALGSVGGLGGLPENLNTEEGEMGPTIYDWAILIFRLLILIIGGSMALCCLFIFALDTIFLLRHGYYPESENKDGNDGNHEQQAETAPENLQEGGF